MKPQPKASPARSPAHPGRSPKPASRGGSLWAWLGCLGLVGGGAFWAGDVVGFARGQLEAATCKEADPLVRMDQAARWHERTLGVGAQHPAPMAPRMPAAATESYTFHETLKGAPGKSLDRGSTLTSAAPQRPTLTSAGASKPATTGAADFGSTALRDVPVTGDYTLQAGAFPDKADALALHDRLKAQGYHPVIVPSEAAGATWYRVRVGHFADRPTADAAGAALENHAHLHGLTLRH